MVEHDDDDPPPVENWIDQYWGAFNRWAETLAGIARMWGLL